MVNRLLIGIDRSYGCCRIYRKFHPHTLRSRYVICFSFFHPIPHGVLGFLVGFMWVSCYVCVGNLSSFCSSVLCPRVGGYVQHMWSSMRVRSSLPLRSVIEPCILHFCLPKPIIGKVEWFFLVEHILFFCIRLGNYYRVR